MIMPISEVLEGLIVLSVFFFQFSVMVLALCVDFDCELFIRLARLGDGWILWDLRPLGRLFQRGFVFVFIKHLGSLFDWDHFKLNFFCLRIFKDPDHVNLGCKWICGCFMVMNPSGPYSPFCLAPRFQRDIFKDSCFMWGWWEYRFISSSPLH